MIKIEDLGIKDVEVFDLHTSNTNMFFGNDILVHNSNYLDFSTIFDDLDSKPIAEALDMIDEFCEGEFQSYLDKCWTELAEMMNCPRQRMYMKRENIADVGIWTAKKRYALNVWDSEGVRYKEPKMKIMGLEPIKSSIPERCREALKTAFKIVLTGEQDELHAFVDKFREEFNTLSFEEIANTTGVNGLEKYRLLPKGTPFHVRGAIMYNRRVDEMGLEKTVEKIKEGDKVRVVYLQEPNPIGEKVVAAPAYLPEELGLTEYIDHNAMFKKNFKEPLDRLLVLCDWLEKSTGSLMELM